MMVCGIMPTRGRQQWASLAVECFLRQTYPDKRLFILDDHDDPSFPIPPTHPDVDYRLSLDRLNIPKKLNRLCTSAPGPIICRFDSDDWSAPSRIERQVEMLSSSGKRVAGFSSCIFIHEKGHRAWKYSGHASYALGTSLCFYKDWWLKHPFPERKDIASDNPFVNEAAIAKQLITASGGQLIVARIHSGNTSPKRVERWGTFDISKVPREFFECAQVGV